MPQARQDNGLTPGADRMAEGHRGTVLEALEQRVLLSFTPDAGTADYITWHGAQIEVIKHSWLLTFDENLGQQGAFEKALDVMQAIGATAESIQVIGRGGFAEVTTGAPISEKVAAFAVAQVKGLAGFQPNLVYHTARVPNDPLFSEQWEHDNVGQFGGLPGADIGSIRAWDSTIGSRDVIIAVVDTGVDWTHPDLADNIYINTGEIAGNGVDDDGNGFIDDVRGWDFGELDNDPMDVQGHGTACAGVIGAVGNNGVGVAGVAWNVQIMPIKIADRFGNLSSAAIVGGHEYLTMMIGRGVNIVASNNSYGAFLPSFYEDLLDGITGEKTAIQNFVNAGGTFVAAAGNSANNNDAVFTSFPASYNIPEIVSVAATDPADGLASFSNWGAETVDLGAPGVLNLTTAAGGGYIYFAGTSSASPAVAGAVALLKSYRPDASAIEVKEALINGCDPIPSLQGRVVSGGRLNVAESLRIINLTGPVVLAIEPGPLSTGSVSQIIVRFSEALDPQFLSTAGVDLVRSGGDGIFGNGNDSAVSLASVAPGVDATYAVIAPSSPISNDTFRLTLHASGFRDSTGDYLNGDALSGEDDVYTFRLAPIGHNFENNDTLATATVLQFNGSGHAEIKGLSIGDGIFGPLDVDIFKIQMSRGGLITARVDAANLPSPSGLDTYLRLFDAAGNELAANDQFNGPDSFLDFFVTTGGSYYVAVSGFPNDKYNPTIGGSGTSQSKGTYNLVVDVKEVENETRTFASAFGGPRAIPDQGVLEDTIIVPDSRLILDVNVAINIDHDFVSDLRVTLISPKGTEVTLLARRGGDGSFQLDPAHPAAATFDDEAAVAIGAAPPPWGGGVFRPDAPLSGVDGESGLGAWTLRVEDLEALNTGRLFGWSMRFLFQNNIFGPFELNDTITTARDLNITGTGSAVRDANIGDGGFGDRDVDLYRFIAGAGTTLSASVQSNGALDSALRLFDGDGREIKVSRPAGVRDSGITNFTFLQGGTYYLGVSEDANTAYDPAVGGSGEQAVTTGSYRLVVALSSGVSDGQAILVGSNITLAVGASGVPGVGSTALRFRGVEFIADPSGSVPGTAFFGASAGGYGFLNDGAGGSVDLPMSLIAQSDTDNRRVVGEARFRDLLVERSVSFAAGADFMVVDVTLTNLASEPMAGVAWMEGFNPQQGLRLGAGGPNTANDVVNGAPLATARFSNNVYQDGLTVGLGAPSADGRASATFLGLGVPIRDARQVLDLGPTDPDGASSDSVMVLAYDIGVLSAGQAAQVRYFVFFGLTPGDVSAMYAELNAGTGSGNLALDPADPALDADGLPSLPYTLYYPEGYANDRASTFIPIVNLNSSDTRVVVIARYETGQRDEVIYDGTLSAGSRGGITVTTPELYAANTQLVRKDTPYALEIRSQTPVAATMSHYDFGASTGEAFTSRTSTVWSFSQVSKGRGSSDFVVFYNASDEAVKVTTTLYREGGGAPIVLTQVVGAHRRGGWNLGAQGEVPAGTYGVVVQSKGALVASVSSYNASQHIGFGALAVSGLGSTAGAIPQGQFGVSSGTETITLLNATSTDATVVLTFSFDNGSSYRANALVKALSRSAVKVNTLAGFQAGRPYAVSYQSPVPVSVAMPTLAAGEGEGAAFTGRGYTYWAFGEGFRPGGQTDQVTEYLRLYNPSSTDTVVDIKVRFADGSSEVFRRLAGAGRVTELDVHSLITGDRRLSDQFYGLTVKSGTPIVAFLGRVDAFFPGAFGSLGTPLGIDQALV